MTDDPKTELISANPVARPEGVDGGRRKGAPETAAAAPSSLAESLSIVFALNRLHGRLSDIEHRLQRIESRTGRVMAAALAIGVLIGLVLQMVDLPFAIAIVPRP